MTALRRILYIAMAISLSQAPAFGQSVCDLLCQAHCGTPAGQERAVRAVTAEASGSGEMHCHPGAAEQSANQANHLPSEDQRSVRVCSHTPTEATLAAQLDRKTGQQAGEQIDSHAAPPSRADRLIRPEPSQIGWLAAICSRTHFSPGTATSSILRV
jgi:hypothetical protein